MAVQFTVCSILLGQLGSWMWLQDCSPAGDLGPLQVPPVPAWLGGRVLSVCHKNSLVACKLLYCLFLGSHFPQLSVTHSLN